MTWVIVFSYLIVALSTYLVGRWHQRKIAITHHLKLRDNYDLVVTRLRTLRDMELKRMEKESKKFGKASWEEQMKMLGLQSGKNTPGRSGSN